MKRPQICAVIVNGNQDATNIAELVDLFEVRIDLIAEGWQQIAKRLAKPWLATNRLAAEGGHCPQDGQERIDALLEAASLGASIVDVELATRDLPEVVRAVKKQAKCLVSRHILHGTPSLDEMKETVRRELDAGADICKLVTTANEAADNLTVLRLIREFPDEKIVACAMGPLGLTSRVLAPLAGGYFTYASIERGGESAPGQITVAELREIYGMLQK